MKLNQGPANFGSRKSKSPLCTSVQPIPNKLANLGDAIAISKSETMKYVWALP